MKTMRLINRVFTFVFVGFGILTVASGCGSNIKAGGTVVFSDGTPLDRGMVVLASPTNQYTGMIHGDGSFKLGGLNPGDGLPAGTYRASVLYAVDDLENSLVSGKYTSAETSGLVFEISKKKHAPLKIVVEPPTPEEQRQFQIRQRLRSQPPTSS